MSSSNDLSASEYDLDEDLSDSSPASPDVFSTLRPEDNEDSSDKDSKDELSVSSKKKLLLKNNWIIARRKASSPFRQAASCSTTSADTNWKEGYPTEDNYVQEIKFTPKRVQGIQVDRRTCADRLSMLANEVSFFMLFFTEELIEIKQTNMHAHITAIRS